MPANRIIPSSRLRSPSHRKSHAIAMLKKSTGISRMSKREWTRSGRTRAAEPRTKVTLVMFEPMAFPTPIARLPDAAAIPETSISGAEVPKATIVSPITKRLTPKLLASPAAPWTKRSAPQTRAMKPTMIAAMA